MESPLSAIAGGLVGIIENLHTVRFEAIVPRRAGPCHGECTDSGVSIA